jgi:hypothetical protein
MSNKSPWVYDKPAEAYKLRPGTPLIEDGQRFDLIHLDGTRKRYVVHDKGYRDWSEDLGPGSIAVLRNLDTGGFGHVTHKWLYDGEMEGRMSFVRAEEQRAAA